MQNGSLILSKTQKHFYPPQLNMERMSCFLILLDFLGDHQSLLNNNFYNLPFPVNYYIYKKTNNDYLLYKGMFSHNSPTFVKFTKRENVCKYCKTFK